MSATIHYAPYIEPVSGTRKLCCVSLKWLDNEGADLASVASSCNASAATYKRLSDGQFNFEPSSYSISVPYEHTNANIDRAVAFAKQALAAKGIKEDGNTTYVMVNNNAGLLSHSHGDTSNLLNTLETTFNHEIGRDDPTVLGSSSVYQDGKLDIQADGTSFMGHFASNELTASQLYYLGWLPNTQVGLYDLTSPATEFTIDPLDAVSSTDNLKAVLIANENKPLFLSKPKFNNGSILYALHLASGNNNRGSERVAVFGENATYDNLSFEQISQNGDTSTVRISPQPKP